MELRFIPILLLVSCADYRSCFYCKYIYDSNGKTISGLKACLDPTNSNETIPVAKVLHFYNVTTVSGTNITAKIVCGNLISTGEQTIGANKISFTAIERLPMPVLEHTRAFYYEGAISFKQTTTLCGSDVPDCRVVMTDKKCPNCQKIETMNSSTFKWDLIEGSTVCDQGSATTILTKDCTYTTSPNQLLNGTCYKTNEIFTIEGKEEMRQTVRGCQDTQVPGTFLSTIHVKSSDSSICDEDLCNHATSTNIPSAMVLLVLQFILILCFND